MLFRPGREALFVLQLGKFELTAGHGQFPGSAAHRATVLGVQQELPDAVDLRVESHISRAAQAERRPTCQGHTGRDAAHQGAAPGTPLGATPLGAMPLGGTPLGTTPLGTTPLGAMR